MGSCIHEGRQTKWSFNPSVHEDSLSLKRICVSHGELRVDGRGTPAAWAADIWGFSTAQHCPFTKHKKASINTVLSSIRNIKLRSNPSTSCLSLPAAVDGPNTSTVWIYSKMEATGEDLTK